MAILEISRRRGKQKVRTSWPNVFEVTENWHALTDDPLIHDCVSLYTQADAQGVYLPRVGNYYLNFLGQPDFALVVKSVDFDMSAKDGCAWEIVVTYNNQIDVQGSDPIEWVQRRWDIQQYQKPVVKDVNGVAITNSANIPFSSPVEIDDARSVLVVTRFFESFSIAAALSWNNKINSDPYMGALPETAKSCVKSADPRRFPGRPLLWEVVYEIHFREETWKKVLLDVGRVGINGQQFVDSFNQPVTDDIAMDGAGNKAAAGVAPAYRSFDVYKKRLFNGFL